MSGITLKMIKKGKSPSSAYIKDVLSDWNGEGKQGVISLCEDRLNMKMEMQADATWSQHELDPVTLDIRHTNEPAYQRAFFLASPTRLQGGDDTTTEINWLDLEVPVLVGNGKRLDLIGKIKDKFVIAELKCNPIAKDGSKLGESPLYAIFEGLDYALSAKEAAKNRITLRYHLSDKAPTNYWPDYEDCAYLIIGANTSYWEKRGEGEVCWKDHIDKLKEVGEWIKNRCGYKILFVEFDDEDFLGQKDKKPLYRPQLLNNKNNIWREL